MKRSIKALATAVALLSCVGPVMAYAPTVAPDFSFYIGGGSEQGTAFLAFAQSLMAPDGNLDVYTDDNINCGQGFNYRAVFGTWKTTAGGIAAGKKVYIAFTSNGGLFKNGVDALVRAHTVDYAKFLNNSSRIDTCIAAPGNGVPFPFTATAQYAWSSNNTEIQTPDVGLSDLEVRMFTGVNLPRAAPNAPLTHAELTSVLSIPLHVSAFGVAINNLLASSMMATFGNTNISSAQVTAILAGTYTDWNQVCQINTSGISVCLPAGPITFMSRSPGSGTKAVFNQYFLNNPGSVGFAGTSVSPVDQVGTVGDCVAFSHASYNVCDQNSSKSMKSALNMANVEGTQAIGILGLEFQPVGIDAYKFANLDGVKIDPTSKTCGNIQAEPFEPARIVNGDHRLYYTNSLSYRIKQVGTAPFAGDNSPHSAFMTAFASTAASPFLQLTIPGALLDPAVGGTGFPQLDQCMTKGTRNFDSTAPLVNLF